MLRGGSVRAGSSVHRNPNAKVITGIRRYGKSTFMRSISKRIDANIIHIDMELWSNRELRDPELFYREIKSRLVSGKDNCLFVDEVQDVHEWESVIRSLIAEKACDIYLTGSNSRLLSSEYSTYLSGGLNTMNMNTLTFRECMDFAAEFQEPADIDEVFTRFLETGGFPAVWNRRYEPSETYQMVRDILSAIMLHDIVSRYDIRNPDILSKIFRFLCDNIRKYTSVNNIFTHLNLEDRGVNKDTVYKYVGYLEDSYVIERANVFDIHGKRILSSKYKYFVADLGLKHSALGYRSPDISGHMENILYTEMRSRGYDVWVGDSEGREIDIVAERNGKRVYIQAVYRFTSDVIEQEFGNLETICDNHPKYVVTMENDPINGGRDGIVCCSLKEFLMKEEF